MNVVGVGTDWIRYEPSAVKLVRPRTSIGVPGVRLCSNLVVTTITSLPEVAEIEIIPEIVVSEVFEYAEGMLFTS